MATTADRVEKWRQKVRDGHVFFDSAEECAKAAAPVFAANRWRWTRCGIPRERDILATLQQLARNAKTVNADDDYCSSGRLTHFEGRYGYERPPAPPVTKSEDEG